MQKYSSIEIEIGSLTAQGRTGRQADLIRIKDKN